MRADEPSEKTISRCPSCDSAAGNVPREVTFRDFAALANRKGWTPEFLAGEFRGKVDGPSEFFHRVLGRKFGDMVIPYQSVLDLYHKELSPLIAEQTVRLCACGCQRQVRGRKRYASSYCRLKVHRKGSQTSKRGSEKAT